MEENNSGSDEIFAVLMAAGFSARFGGDNKLLVPFRGKPLARWTLDVVARIPEITARFFITASSDVASLAAAGVYAVHNPEPEKGQRESIRLGIEAADERFQPHAGKQRYYFFFPCDQPLLDEGTIRLILESRRPGYIAQPFYRGERSSPVIFSAEFAPELKALAEGERGRTVIDRHNDKLIRVTVPERDGLPSPLIDIDSPETLREAMRDTH